MKRTLFIMLALVLACACLAVAHADVVSTTPIVDEQFWGYRVTAVAVEYDTELAAQEFAADAFAATDILDTDNAETQYLYGQPRVISRIYTNSEPATLAEGAAEGKYVIVEFSADDIYNSYKELVGLLPIRGYYTNAKGAVSKCRVTKPNEGTIQQLVDITAKDGTVLAATEELKMTNDYLVTGLAKEFELVDIPRENSDIPYKAWVHLPSDYDGTKEYPVVFIITGNAQLHYVMPEQGIDNTDVVLYNDHQMLTWAETADFGFEEVIAVSLRKVNIVTGLDVDVYEDTAAAAKWIIENYAVDHNRLYWVGQSAGSVACWNIISAHPELCTGYFGTNGGVSAAYDLSPEGLTQEAIDETWKVLKVFVENRIPICFTCGEEDANSANHYAAEFYYPMLHDAYAAEGLSEREIYDMVKIYVMPHSTYAIAPDLTDHNVVRMMNWLVPARIFEMSTVLGW